MDATLMTVIEAQCTREIFLYARRVDSGEWDALSDMFTDDGRLARPSDPETFLTGRVAILAAFKERPHRISRHVVSNVIVDVQSPSLAHCFSVICLFRATAQSDGPDSTRTMQPVPLIGTFEDIMVLQDGCWKFRERRGALDFDP